MENVKLSNKLKIILFCGMLGATSGAQLDFS